MIDTTTDRLVLRGLEERDAEMILLLNSDPEVLRYVHDEPFADVHAARHWILDIPRQLPRGIGRWAIESKEGVWIGRCSLRRYADGEVLMGYRLLREHWDQGFASEAVRAMLDLAFIKHQLHYIASKIARGNTASQRVIEKNGGRYWKDGRAENFAEALVYRFDWPLP
ncbi:MAG: GNAT family N-acetyltransferase [Flavobacteriales bacterium]|nr:GNAT family N-acetyltransferase [Flavobacteriales bacterium]